jgi:hypothetical protein
MAMTTHVEKVASTGGSVASFPARKTETRWIVPVAGLAIVFAVAALVMYVGTTNSEVASAIPASQVPTPVDWAVPASDAAGVEYSPANPYVGAQTDWAVAASDAAGVEYSPSNPYVGAETDWAVAASDAAGVEYSPSNPYVGVETALTLSTGHGQGGPR